MRERDSDADWFPVEFLIYYDDHDKVRTFAYVRKEDGSEILGYLTASMTWWTNLANTAADGRSGKASGRSNGDTDGERDLNCCY